HADALADDGMNLPCGVADEEGAVVAQAYSWPQGSGGEPRPDPGGAGQGLSHSAAFTAQECLHDLTGSRACLGVLTPAGGESVPPDTAGESSEPFARHDHAAVAAGK